MINNNCNILTNTVRHSDISLFVVCSFFMIKLLPYTQIFLLRQISNLSIYYYYRFLVWGKDMNEILKRCKYNAIELKELSKLWLAI